MTKQEIRNCYTGVVIFACEADTLKEALEKAVKDGVHLSYADLSGKDLSNVDLSNADLIFANLSNANLTGANLTGADLRGAKLPGTNLSNVNLSSADLTGVNFSNANFDNVDLHDAYLRDGANRIYLGKTKEESLKKLKEIQDQKYGESMNTRALIREEKTIKKIKN